MKRNIKKYFEDILISVQDIEKYSFGVSSVAEIEENQMLFDALCMRFAKLVKQYFK